MNQTYVAVAAACLLASAADLASAQSGPTQEELNRADRSTEWLLPNHDYAGVRYVDLKQITPANAGSLRPVCMFQGADLNRALNNPLVYRGVMYVTTLLVDGRAGPDDVPGEMAARLEAEGEGRQLFGQEPRGRRSRTGRWSAAPRTAICSRSMRRPASCCGR